MPFKPIDFASIPAQGNPFFRDLVENLATGYKAGQLPQELERQRKKEELANQLQEYLVKEQPQKFSEESQQRQLKNAFQSMLNQQQPAKFGSEQLSASVLRAFQQAQTGKIQEELKLPFAGKIPPGSVGQALYTNMIKSKYGENSPEYKDARASYEAELSHTQVTSDRQKQLANSGMFRSLNADDKRRVVAYGVGMGYSPEQVAKELSNGETLLTLAAKKGVNLSDVAPNYALTTPVITQSQTRNAFISEIGELQKDLIEPLAKVSRKVGGYSPKLLWGQISGKMSAEEQGQILAANALQPELAGLRARTLGSQNVGIELVREMEQKALADLKTVEGLVSPEAYRSMSYHINNYIERANAAFNRSLHEQSKLGGQSTENNEPQSNKRRKIKL